MSNDVVKTLIIAELVLALLLVIPVLGVQATQRARSKRNHIPQVQSFTSSMDEIDLCPSVPSSICSYSGTMATLEVKASDLDNDTLSYTYSVTAGKIVGNGAIVNWDLTGSPLGIQTARVGVADRRGGRVSRTTTAHISICGSCDPPRSWVGVKCPASITEGEIASFEATVGLGFDPPHKLTYLWNHSNGKVVGRQDKARVRIRATGRPGNILAATVRVLGLEPSANYQATCESKIEKRVP